MRLSLIIFLVVIPTTVYASCYDVRVQVNEFKANGKHWDPSAFQAPDIKVCFYDPWGQRCKAKVERFSAKKAHCEDSYNCELGVIHFSSSITRLRITDVDYGADEAIDSGECNLNENECVMGNATVFFENTTCPN